MLSTGTWWVSSKEDPRWNGTGIGSVGMFGLPEGAKAHTESKKKELGDPPDDLEYGYMKD